MSEFPYIHPDYKEALPYFEKWRDAAAGEDRVKKRGERYLPRLFEMDDEEYKQYLDGASYYNATGKTIDACTGAHFLHEATVNLPRELEGLKEKASRNRTLAELLYEATREIWTVGRLGLLAEFDEHGAPQLFTYKAESIVNWYEEDGELLWVILCETYTKLKEGERYLFETAKQYRILEIEEGVYVQRLLQEKKDANGKGTWVEVERIVPQKAGGGDLDFIPFAILNFEGDGCAVGGSPTADLGNLNFRHFVGTADHWHTLHLTACAFLEVVGLPEEDRPKKFRVGSSTVLYLPIGGSSKYTEPEGKGLGAQKADLQLKEDQMARIGGTFLRAQKREAETAESWRLQQSGESSVMVRVVGAVSKGVTQAIRCLARWLGLKKPEDASVSLSTEFFEVKIELPEAEFLVKLYQAGLLGLEQLFEGLQGGGILKKEWLQTLMEQAKKTKEQVKGGEVKNDAQEKTDQRAV